MTAPRLTTAGSSGAWRAQLRCGRRILADCGHRHPNRRSGSGNAEWCGRQLIMAVTGNDYFTAERFVDDAIAAARRARSLGARITDDEASATAAATLQSWRDAAPSPDLAAPKWGTR